MKLTNKNNLPIQFVNAVNVDYRPTPHQYSVTTVLNSVRQTLLQRRHTEEIEDDVSNQIWAILGTAFHSLMENSKESANELKEEYLKQNLNVLHEDLKDYFLSGKADLYDADQKKIVDFKTTSAFKFVKKDFEDYRLQLLMYAWLFRKIGFEVNEGEIIAVLRDWQKSKAKFDKDYPQLQVQKVNFKFTEKDFEFIEDFIKVKFLELKKYEEVPDDELPICNEEERWAEPTKYAVKKKANKTASRLHDTLEEAETHLRNLEEKYPNIYEIEVREGTDKKCSEYCSACRFCKYWKEKYEGNTNNEIIQQ